MKKHSYFVAYSAYDMNGEHILGNFTMSAINKLKAGDMEKVVSEIKKTSEIKLKDALVTSIFYFGTE